ncbi:MAG: hypothetical protein HC897_14560 [Thermoanaerobaculia bacterium]|nr:hypothetical protein [Thermoanaerobaculia bacterium]
MLTKSRLFLVFIGIMMVLAWPFVGKSGTFLVYDSSVSIFLDEDDVLHPYLYTGTGGARTVRVCIDPTSPFGTQMVPSLRAAIQNINTLQHSTENLVDPSAEVPASSNDFYSVALHELLHCVAGVGHVNFDSQVVGDLPSYSTNSFGGADGALSLTPGGDGTYGTADDARGDDINLFWFNRGLNDPYRVLPTVDETTYSRAAVDLPSGHSFAANGNFIAAGFAGFPNLKPVMEVASFPGTEVRTLAPDDSVNLRYGTTGLDEIAGTSDDYSLLVEFGGVSTAGCHVLVRFAAQSPDFLAGCETQAIAIQPGARHFRLAGTGEIRFNSTKRWHFYAVSVFSDGFEAGDTSAWASTVP